MLFYDHMKSWSSKFLENQHVNDLHKNLTFVSVSVCTIQFL